MVVTSKYRKEILTMAETTPNSDSLNAAQDVLMDLKSKASEAERRGDAYTFGLMNQLVKVVSPIVTKAHARLLREEKADLNKRHQTLKANAQKPSGNIPFKRED
jgi:hypothetical protein